MSRDKFISDDLYNMRERFKRNHSERSPETAPDRKNIPAAENDSEPVKSFASRQESPSAADAAADANVPEKTHISRLPQIVTAGDNSDTARERRELEGKMLRDLSFIESETTFIREHTMTLEKFRTTIERLLDELSNRERLDERKISQLRSEYFQACGRFESSINHNGHRQNSNTASTVQTPAANQWALATAIIISALIVSFTMLWLFGG